MGETSSSQATKPQDSEPSTCSGVKRRIPEGSSLFELLPLEMTLEVFNYLPMEDVIRLGNETALLNSAARIHVKCAMIGLRRSINKNLRFLAKTMRNLPMNRDHLRGDIVDSFYLTRYISTEVELLFASTWRYRDDQAAWNILAPLLGPAVSEFERVIAARVKVELPSPGLTAYEMTTMLKDWYTLKDGLVNGLYDTLNAVASRKTPFEIRVIDILMCAPTYSFQLALKRTAENQQYNVYGFFKTNNLKPGQVLDGFNSEVDANRKKWLLLSYLTETVQRENLYFLAEFTNRIYELEIAGTSFSDDDNNQLQIMNRLSEEYGKVHTTPYSPVFSQYQYRVPKELYAEYYVRCPHKNLSLTGLQCIVVAPRQDVNNIPLAIPFLRGRRQKLYDHFECQAMDAELSNLSPPFMDYPSHTELTSSNAKPKLQLVIHYRESIVVGPSKVVINISYDAADRCFITFDKISGESLNPPEQ